QARMPRPRLAPACSQASNDLLLSWSSHSPLMNRCGRVARTISVPIPVAMPLPADPAERRGYALVVGDAVDDRLERREMREDGGNIVVGHAAEGMPRHDLVDAARLDVPRAQ